MSEQMVKIHNVETNEISLRKMTAEELNELKIEKAIQLEKDEKEAAKAAARLAAEAKLTALGLTADDLKALGLA